MIKGHLKKPLVFFIGVIITLLCIVVFSSMYTKSNSYDQEKADTGETDKIKAILLKPEGWVAEWLCDEGPYPSTAITDLVFEARRNKMVVKIHSPAYFHKCERKVTITSDGLILAGCYAVPVQLIFDPNDNRYPFKGENQTCVLKLKIKGLR